MRTIGEKHSAVIAGAVAIGCLGLLPDCGSGTTSGNSEDASSDGTVLEASETDDGGGEAAPDSEGDATTLREAGADATFDAGGDASSEAALEAGPDATLDAESGPADTGVDAMDAGGEGGDAEAGPPEAGGIPCDVDAQADAQVCVGPVTMACCGGFCVDTAADPRNCGQCGNGCTTSQFCTGVQCEDAIVSHVCDNPKATVVFDMYPSDNEAGATIASALVANCVPAPAINEVGQDAGGVLDPTTGRPILGVGNTLVNGGGSFGQRGLSYLEQAGIAPLYPYLNNQNYNLVDRVDGGNVVATTPSAINSTHDFFYVQLAVEPQSGTLCFAGAGLGSSGTQAAGYYLSTVILPNRASYPKAWYVYEWTDGNADSIPNNGDAFALVASGP